MRSATWLLVVAFLAGCRASSAPAAGAQGDTPERDERARIEASRTAVRANPSDGQARLELARALLETGDWVAAAPEAIRAADLLPGHADAQKLAISMLLGQQRFSEALERTSRERAMHPDDPALEILFGNASAGLANSWSVIERYDRDWQTGKRSELTLVRPRSAEADRRADEAFRRAERLAPGLAEAPLARANLAWAQGRLREGETVLRQVADRNPHDVLVNRALGLSYASRGEHADAQRYLRAAGASGDATSLEVLAEYYARQDRAEDALGVYDELASGPDPGDVAAVRAARLEVRLGRIREALSRVDGVLQATPAHSEALLIKAQVLLQAGDAAQALSIARAARDRAPMSAEARVTCARALLATGARSPALEELSEAWRLDPTDPAVAHELATLALALDRTDQALTAAREAVRLSPDDRAAAMTLVRTVLRTAAGARDLQAAEHALTLFLNRGRPSPDLLALQAGLQSASGRREAARNTYLAALRLDPGSLDALSGLISLELEEGGAVRVRPYVARAVEAHSDQADYLVLAARVSAAVGDLAHAERAARSALSHSPAHVPATLLLSDVLMRLGRGDEARQLVEQALAREPASFSLQFALGQILEGFGRLADARATYERLAAPTRQGAQASARLAALHTRQGNLDLALSFASTAKQYLPADPMVSDTLGWVYVQKGVPSLGVPHLEEAVRLEPEQAVFRYHLGLAYRATGRIAKAVEQLKRALALDPRLPGAAEALAALLK